MMSLYYLNEQQVISASKNEIKIWAATQMSACFTFNHFFKQIMRSGEKKLIWYLNKCNYWNDIISYTSPPREHGYLLIASINDEERLANTSKITDESISLNNETNWMLNGRMV